jgi:hypothetical protein
MRLEYAHARIEQIKQKRMDESKRMRESVFLDELKKMKKKEKKARKLEALEADVLKKLKNTIIMQ